MGKRYSNTIRFIFCSLILLINTCEIFAQQSVGIGTATPDSKAALDITSTTKGVFAPRLNAAQQTTLAAQLNSTQKGLMITDSLSGNLKYWDGAVWQIPGGSGSFTAKAPLAVTANAAKINAGTAAGDLMTWDGNNWVNVQPAVQHFNYTLSNLQPYLAMNYCISLYGIFPSQNDAGYPFVGEIVLLGCNYAPNGFAFCNGQLVSIAEYETLFNLIGTTYGGDGQSTFALPDLRGRVAIHQGQGAGTSNYTIGELLGTETKTFSQ